MLVLPFHVWHSPDFLFEDKDSKEQRELERCAGQELVTCANTEGAAHLSILCLRASLRSGTWTMTHPFLTTLRGGRCFGPSMSLFGIKLWADRVGLLVRTKKTML